MTAPWFWDVPPGRRGLSPPVATLFDGVLTISVYGSLDAETDTEVHEALYGILEAHHADHVVLDLAELDFLDSAGLRVLLRVHREAVTTGATFELREPQPQIAALLRVTGADAIFRGPSPR